MTSFFAGVYYHLKNPVLALQRIRRLLTDGGALFIEGASTTDYLAEQVNNALELPKSRMRTTAEILDRLPLFYFDAENKIWAFNNWWFPTTRGLELIMVDSGFRNVTCELKRNAFCNYSYRRLMGRAEADPANPNPGEQEREHWAYTREPYSDEPDPFTPRRLLSWLPPGLRQAAKRGRRAVRQILCMWLTLF
jgi:hypothetical protein